MAIVRQLNKKTGVTYVYESHSYRDETTKQPRAKRKLIGRLDEVTGEIIPTRKRTRVVTTPEEHEVGLTDQETPTDAASASTLELLKEKEQVIREQRTEINRLMKEREKLAAELQAISSRLLQ